MPRRLSVSKIKKRDGRIVEFDSQKITNAIYKACVATGMDDRKLAERLSEHVVQVVSERIRGETPGVEDVQDIVEEVIAKSGYPNIAKAYILYRQERTEIREAKRLLGIQDELKLPLTAIKVLKRRYLLRDERGNVVETPAQMFHRVAKAVAEVESAYVNRIAATNCEERFYRLMASLRFLPNSPTLMNAGTEIGQLSACFVLPVEDSIEGIFDSTKFMAIIHQSGGGTGFSFSKLRSKGDLVRSTRGVASGPLSFMRVFDTATDVVKQGGRRRGANMGILRVDHPDILEFVMSKSREGFLSNFNISVAATDAFMKAVEKDEEYKLINPRSGEVTERLNARYVFDLMATMAWKTGDPGIVFIDEINRHNPTPNLGEIESTNPCGEQPLLPYESCNLGSINLSQFVEDGQVDWETLRETVRTSVHFLDNVIDANKYPLPQVKRVTKGNRKIGLGVMGFAEALIKMKVPYDSERALIVGEKFMKFIAEEARAMSIELGKQRGSFPNFEGSVWDSEGCKTIRNAALSTVAPTGTVSLIAGTTSGIEPLFAVAYVRDMLEGSRLLIVNELFEKIAFERRFHSRELISEIAKRGSIQEIEEVPDDVRRLFVTALDIAPEWHVRMQAAFQKHVDSAVAKTVNLPNNATPEDVRRVFLLAYKLKCKGITVYRYGSRKEQVLYVGLVPRGDRPEEEYVRVESDYAGGCPSTHCPF